MFFYTRHWIRALRAYAKFTIFHMIVDEGYYYFFAEEKRDVSTLIMRQERNALVLS